MQIYRFKRNFYRQSLVATLIALMVFSSMPSWLHSGRGAAFSSIDAEIAKAFDELANQIANLPRTTVTVAQRGSFAGKIKEAKGSFAGGDLCGSAKIMEAFAEETQGL